MTSVTGRARSRLEQVRTRLRQGWGLPDPKPEAEPVDWSQDSEAAEAAMANSAIEPASPLPESPEPPAAVIAEAPGTLPEAVPVSSAKLSRRDLMLAGAVAGVSGLAVGIMRSPLFTPPPFQPSSRPPARLAQVAEHSELTELFEAPPPYIASEGFPERPAEVGPVPARTAAITGPEMQMPAVRHGPLLAERRLALFNENTGEKVSATYWANGDYVLEELEAIHVLLRDHHAEEVRAMDLQLVETLFRLGETLETKEPLHILSGYRTRHTNRKLAERYHGVAVNSFHIKGKAVDVRVPGRSKRDLLRAAVALKAGGVGNYRSYIHIDTGPVRRWGG